MKGNNTVCSKLRRFSLVSAVPAMRAQICFGRQGGHDLELGKDSEGLRDHGSAAESSIPNGRTPIVAKICEELDLGYIRRCKPFCG